MNLAAVLLSAAIFLLSGCSDSNEPQPRNGEFSFVDPAGDVREIASGTVEHDIRRVSGYVESDSLVLTLAFARSVEPGMDGYEREVMGLIHFDTDENAATGGIVLQGWAHPVNGLGADYGLDLRTMTLHPMVPEHAPGTRIRTEWLGKSVRLHIALTLLGGDDGRMNMAGVVSPPVAAFDNFPDAGYYELTWTPGQ